MGLARLHQAKQRPSNASMHATAAGPSQAERVSVSFSLSPCLSSGGVVWLVSRLSVLFPPTAAGLRWLGPFASLNSDDGSPGRLLLHFCLSLRCCCLVSFLSFLAPFLLSTTDDQPCCCSRAGASQASSPTPALDRPQLARHAAFPPIPCAARLRLRHHRPALPRLQELAMGPLARAMACEARSPAP